MLKNMISKKKKKKKFCITIIHINVFVVYLIACKNSSSGTTRSTRLSDCFHVLCKKASLNGLNPSFLFDSLNPSLGQQEKENTLC